MLTSSEPAATDRASSAVRLLARSTNLLLAGRTFGISHEGPLADALARMVAGLGGRPVSAGEAPDLLLATGPIAGPGGVAARTLVVDLHGELTRTAAAAPSAAASELRNGVVRYPDAEPPLTLLPFVEHPDPRASLGDAAKRIAWARTFMPVSTAIAGELSDAGILRGLRVGISMVLEPKTANLALLLRDAGAEVSVFAHASETDDAVAAALRAQGIPVDAEDGATEAREAELAARFLSREPQILLDDGSHLIRMLHAERPELLEKMIGAAEETTSGLRPLREMDARGALRIPVVAVNDAVTKTRFDNRYGTGQSCVCTIIDLLEAADGWRSLAGRTVAVIGYGPVGEGVAQFAAAFGADVIVSDIDPRQALQAVYAGHRTDSVAVATAHADLVISATGEPATVTLDILRGCRPETVFAVAGGVANEIELDAALAAGAAFESVVDQVERLRFADGHRVTVLDRGGCINVTAGEGNPIEIMDLSFAVQLSALRMLAESESESESGTATRLRPGVHPIPVAADRAVAAIALTTMGTAR